VNEQQLIIFLQQAFGAERLGADVIKAVEAYFRGSMEQIQAIVAALPDDSLVRELLWNRSLPEVQQALQGYNDAFAQELIGQMTEYGPEQAEAAARILEAGAPGRPVIQAQLPSSVARQLAANTEFVNTKLINFFDGPFVRNNVETINRVVRQGMLQSLTTEDIAKQVQSVGENIMRSEARTVARTSIQTFNNSVNHDVWSNHLDLIDAWEWVAVLDSRTCPTCAPLDGSVKKKRSEFPFAPPAHPNCRCQVMPYWEDEDVRKRSAQQVYADQQEGPRAYKTKVKVKGDKLYRKAVDVRAKDGKTPTYADFLAGTNRKTLQMFFGGGNAGSIRAERFLRLNERYNNPQRALNALLNSDKGGVKRFKPVDKLPK